MYQIEADGCLGKDFNFGKIDYHSKGGCLCDAIGMGKTATVGKLFHRNFNNPPQTL